MCLTKKEADQLCTVIALGYTKKELVDGRKKSKIIDTEEAELKKLRDLFAEVGLSAANEQMETMPRDSSGRVDKSMSSSIVAVDGRTPAEAVNDEISNSAAFLNSYVDTGEESLLKGAYVGGMDNISVIEFIGPSYLWQYKGQYRSITGEEAANIKKAYDNAFEVSNKVESLLKDAVNSHRTFRSNAVRLMEGAEKVKRESWEQNADLFASVHGMTRSIFAYRASADKHLVRIELALSKGTCKVASCIPCAIFMASQGYPASAVHFGRGDNWNFYKGVNKADTPYKNWSKAVLEYYDEGIGVMSGRADKVREWTTYLAGKTKDKIPEIFLEALTFESAFTDKIDSTLK